MIFTEHPNAYSVRIMREETAKDVFDTELEMGIIVTFGKFGNPPKNKDSQYKLCEIIFPKEVFNMDSVNDFLADYTLRYFSKKNSWNRKIPLADNIYDIGNDEYIALCVNGTGKKEFLWKQIELLCEGETPVHVACEGENPLKVLFKERLKENDPKSVVALFKEFNDDLKEIAGEYPPNIIADFAEYFELVFCTDAEVQNEYYKAYPGEDPIIIQIQRSVETADFLGIGYFLYEDELTDQEIRTVDTLSNYLLSLPGDKYCTLLSDIDNHVVILYENENNDDTENTFEIMAKSMLSMFLINDGSLVVRCRGKEKDTLMMFRSEEGKITPVSKEECKWAAETQPDGSRIEYPNQIYKRAEVIF